MRHPLVKTLLFLLLLPYALSLPYGFIHPPSTLMLAGWITGEKVERNWVPLDKIAPSLKAAVIASEDSAFCDHYGFDFRQIEKSIEKAQNHNQPVRATSTITQQVAKNLFLWHGRSWIRKALEVPLTFWLELVWSKKRVLEVYLNIAEWGDGVYGAEAAARAHFYTSAQNLSFWQSSLLATSLPNPIDRSASRPGTTQSILAAQLLVRAQRHGPDLSCIY